MTGIIILNFNNARLTLDCVDSVVRVNTAPAKFVIVDNASADDSMEVLRDGLSSRFGEGFETFNMDDMPDRLPLCSLVRSDVNGGYAQGNNVGLRLAENDDRIDNILILNNDIVFTEDIIPELAHFIGSTPGAGIASPLLLKKDGESIDFNCARKDCTLKEIACYYLLYCRDFHGILSKFARRSRILVNNPKLIDAPSIPIELPSGSCMMISKSLFREIGYFDPNTFLYYEESILYRKLLAAGRVNYLLPAVRCIHLGAQTTANADRSYSYLRNSNKSAYYYVMHYRDLNLFQKSGFALLYGFYNCLLFIKQYLNSIFR